MILTLDKLTEIVTSAAALISKERVARQKSKGVGNFVTAADLAVEEYIKNRLSDYGIAFCGEETEKSDSRERFILDPIDGTANLTFGLYPSVISLCYFCAEPKLGVVYDFERDRLYAAEKGKGATVNNEPLHVHKPIPLSDSIVVVGTSPYDKTDTDRMFDLFKAVFSSALDIRRSGSAAYDLCCVAHGSAGAYIEAGLKPWDFAAGALIAAECGCIVSDYQGAPLDFCKNQNVVCANPGAYAAIKEFTCVY